MTTATQPLSALQYVRQSKYFLNAKDDGRTTDQHETRVETAKYLLEFLLESCQPFEASLFDAYENKLAKVIAPAIRKENLNASDDFVLAETRAFIKDFARQTAKPEILEAVEARIAAANRIAIAEPESVAAHTPAACKSK